MRRNALSPRRYKTLRYLLYALAMLVFFQAVFVLLVLVGVWGPLPDEEALRKIQNPLASEVYSADGVLMGTFAIQNRQFMGASGIPEAIRNALVATEDARFFKHRGIDTRSLGRVFIKTLLLQKQGAGGGSTITQQLAKNLYPRGDHGALSMPVNKVREMVIARRMEELYSKDDILEMYLSTVPFGENTFGIKAASRRFFNKDPQDLLVEEISMLVGMLKGTRLYNPVLHPDNALERRNVVLAQQARYGYLDTAIADSLQLRPLIVDYHPLPHNAGIAPYFREFIRAELDRWCRERSGDGEETINLYTDGLKIFTTIDSRLQSYAEKAMKSHMAQLQELFDKQWEQDDLWDGIRLEQLLINYEGEYRSGMDEEEKRKMPVFTWDGIQEKEFNTLDSVKHYLRLLQTGFLAMDVHTAEIRAWIGGIDHAFFKYDHVLARRQPGSTFKPLVYLEALEQEISPCEYFANDSIVYEDFDNWTPRNADRSYGGYYSLKGALVHSVNTVSVDVLMQVGIDSVLELSRRAGIASPLPEVPSLALGTGAVSLYEMMKVYQAIANMGVRKDPVYIRRIEDRNGLVLEERMPDADGTALCSAENAALLVGMLKEVVDEGTAAGLRREYHMDADIAGKTGTTQDYTDGWFIGFTPSLLAGVWVGGDLPHIRFQNMSHGQGAATAMPIWAEFMKEVWGDQHLGSLKQDTFALDAGLRRQLDCEDYREKKPLQFRPIQKLREKKLFKKLFRRKNNSSS